MIELFYWTSMNAQKILVFLEETGLDYKLTGVNITKGEQYSPDFVRIAPNSRLPVIIDRSSDEEVIVFESGAILMYLAEKTGRFLPVDTLKRFEVLQWLFWQVSALGPIGGQVVHFKNYAPRPIEYAIKRYETENERLLKVLDKQLEGREYIAGEYSIADMACHPWIYAHHRRGQITYDNIPNVSAWFDRLNERPAVKRAYEVWANFLKGPVVKNFSEMDENARRILFGSHAVE